MNPASIVFQSQGTSEQICDQNLPFFFPPLFCRWLGSDRAQKATWHTIDSKAKCFCVSLRASLFRAIDSHVKVNWPFHTTAAAATINAQSKWQLRRRWHRTYQDIELLQLLSRDWCKKLFEKKWFRLKKIVHTDFSILLASGHLQPTGCTSARLSFWSSLLSPLPP